MNIRLAKNLSYWKAFLDVVMYKHGVTENKQGRRDSLIHGVTENSKQSHRGSLIAFTKQFGRRLTMKSRRKDSDQLIEVDEQEKREIPLEGEERMQLDAEDQHFLDTNPSLMGNELFPISTETSHMLTPAHLHAYSFGEVEEDLGYNNQIYDLPASADTHLPTQKIEEEIKVGDVVIGKVEMRHSSMGL